MNTLNVLARIKNKAGRKWRCVCQYPGKKWVIFTRLTDGVSNNYPYASASQIEEGANGDEN
ncbi:hypothetical protein [Serratia sp. D1N4]